MGSEINQRSWGFEHSGGERNLATGGDEGAAVRAASAERKDNRSGKA
jgi:hypothetical protein